MPTVGNLYGLRNWVEYGLKQSKNELGWADFRVTNYAQIERWWEMVMSAYLLVSSTQTHCISLNHNLRSNAMLTPSNRAQTRTISGLESGKRVETGAQQFAFSDSALGDLEFASTLNLFPIPRLSAGLECLVALNRFPSRLPCHAPQADFHFPLPSDRRAI